MQKHQDGIRRTISWQNGDSENSVLDVAPQGARDLLTLTTDRMRRGTVVNLHGRNLFARSKRPESANAAINGSCSLSLVQPFLAAVTEPKKEKT